MLQDARNLVVGVVTAGVGYSSQLGNEEPSSASWAVAVDLTQFVGWLKETIDP